MSASENKQTNSSARAYFGVPSKIRAFAKGLAHTYDIIVQFEGTGAHTNGSTVYLPLPRGNITDKESDIYIGFVEHEIAHVMFSDFKGANSPANMAQTMLNKYPDVPTEYVTNVINAVEDIRVETLMSVEQQGASYFLDILNNSLLDKLVLGYEDNVQHALSAAMLHSCYTHAGGNIDHPTWKICSKSYSEYDTIVDVLRPVVKDIVKNADIYSGLKDGSCAFLDAIMSYLNKKTSTKNDQSENSQSTEAKEKIQEDLTKTSISTSGIENKRDEVIKSMTSELSNIIPTGRESDMVLNTKDGKKVLQSTIDIGKENASKLKRALSNVFMSHKNKLNKRYLDQGILDSSRLQYYLHKKDFNVFKDVKKFRRINTSVHVSIDVSGSMGNGNRVGSRSEYARRAIIGIDYALKNTGVNLSVSMFSTSFKVIKTISGKLTCLDYVTGGGGTRIDKALMKSGRYLAGSRDPRKILIIITDADTLMDLAPAHTLVVREGIEVYYVSVGNFNLQHNGIPSKVCAHFTGNFSGDFIDHLEKIITGKK